MSSQPTTFSNERMIVRGTPIIPLAAMSEKFLGEPCAVRPRVSGNDQESAALRHAARQSLMFGRVRYSHVPLTTSLFVWLIGIYQKHISPYKGFRCAQRVRHGGLSCSEAVRVILLEDGLWCGRSRIRQRFQECRAASLSLRAECAVMSEEVPGEEVGDERRDDHVSPPKPPRQDVPDALRAAWHCCSTCSPDCGGAVLTSGVDGCSCTPW